MNSLFIIMPRRTEYGIWIFDDETTGLVREPFVGETNDLIDRMAIEAGVTQEEADTGVALVFSHQPFPNHQCALTLTETALSGSTYRSEQDDLNPWLCPAMFKYFPQAPPMLYGMVQKPKK